MSGVRPVSVTLYCFIVIRFLRRVREAGECYLAGRLHGGQNYAICALREVQLFGFVFRELRAIHSFREYCRALDKSRGGF